MIDVTDLPYRVVARYRDNKITPLLYPSVIHRFAKEYNDAWLVVEANDIGGQVADTLYYDLEYEHMLSSVIRGRAGQVVTGGFAKDTIFGIKTTPQVKRIGCSTLKTLLEEDKLLLLDFDTISELTTFSVKGKSYQATDGANDDLVMTLVLFSWVTQQQYFKDLMDQDLRTKMYADRMKQLEEDVLPFGFISDGTEIERFTDGDGQVWTYN